MKYIRLAGASLNQTPLDFNGNKRNIINAIEEAKAQGVSLLCLPELGISGYGCEDAFFSDYIIERSLESLEEIAEACEDITVSVGLPMVYEHCLYNVVCLIHNKEVQGFVAKQELAGDGIYYEPRWFKRWVEQKRVDYTWKGVTYPFGDLLFEIDTVRIGFEICEDAWNGIRPAQRHYRHNVDVILNPSASNFALGKSEVRKSLVTETSRSYSCTYVYSNLLGNESGRIIFDGEILISQEGKLLARNQRLGFSDFQVVSTVVDIDRVTLYRKKSFNFEPETPPHLIEIEGIIPEAMPEKAVEVPNIEDWETEFYLAETLGLFDYMRKSWSRGFVLSLSGGADSSCCAVLIAKSFERAEKELGRERFLEKIAYTGIDLDIPIAQQLFTCVYQATANSGGETLQSAEELAKGLGATFYHWDVEPLHKEYKGL
ncbi:NAD+ synthetase, partial [bacterium]|nr:NAD+ synthetase [bacterium]